MDTVLKRFNVTTSKIAYNAEGGGFASISFPINPLEILDIPANHTISNVKSAFRSKVNHPSRQHRAMVSIASHILTSTTGRYRKQMFSSSSYVINTLDHFTMVAIGHTKALAALIEWRPNILDQVDEHGRTLLYLASKFGFYDTCKMLLRKGANVNRIQRDRSTALHAAAYYGHSFVVGLLLEYGAITNIKNNFGNTALEESQSVGIRNFIKAAKSDPVSSLAADLKAKNLVSNVRLVTYNEKVVGKELLRDLNSLDSSTRSEWVRIERNWESAWHGTRYRHLSSIIRNGLLPAGSGGVTPPPNHVALGRSYFGVENWAAAIFVSPSLKYAGHNCYSERVLSNSTQWCVLVKVFVKSKSYKAYDPTIYKFDSDAREPDTPEYRVPVENSKSDVIFRVESARNIVVKSLVFVNLRFLEEESINYKEALDIFA